MADRRTQFAMWLLALMLILACVPTLNAAPPAAPTLDLDAINKIVAQTANAASTQTVEALPTSTPTETSTPLPRGTDTPEPTVTETFIYVFKTPTAFVIPSLVATFSSTSKKDYVCAVLNSPEDGVVYSPRLAFKVRWRLKNVGRKEWDAESIDFIFETGDKFHKVSGYDLTQAVEIGDVVEFFVDMRAPKEPGSYTAYWSLRRGTEKFCRVSLTIVVR